MTRTTGLKIKRLMDIVGASVAILIFAPIMAAVAIAIYLNLGYPVLFKGARIGFKGRPFAALKFRSMKDVYDEKGNMMPDAYRLTRLSKFIRATSFDELPQLFNILKGDMSMIGPRPIITEFKDYLHGDEWRRHTLRPGITGWAQVNGRNALEWDKRLQADLWYVDNWSLKLDIKIILMTIPVWLTASGISTPGFATYQPLHELREKKVRPAAVLAPAAQQSDVASSKEMTSVDG